MKVELQSIDSYFPPQVFAFDDLPVMIGRSANVEISLNDPMVSHRHCELEEKEGILVVRDLDSKNGTYIDGYRIMEGLLMSGHRLTVGRSSFLVCYEYSATMSQAGTEHEEACPC